MLLQCGRRARTCHSCCRDPRSAASRPMDHHAAWMSRDPRRIEANRHPGFAARRCAPRRASTELLVAADQPARWASIRRRAGGPASGASTVTPRCRRTDSRIRAQSAETRRIREWSAMASRISLDGAGKAGIRHEYARPDLSSSSCFESARGRCRRGPSAARRPSATDESAAPPRDELPRVGIEVAVSKPNVHADSLEPQLSDPSNRLAPRSNQSKDVIRLSASHPLRQAGT